MDLSLLPKLAEAVTAVLTDAANLMLPIRRQTNKIRRANVAAAALSLASWCWVFIKYW